MTLPIEPRSEGTAENAKHAERIVLGDLRGLISTFVCMIAAATSAAQSPTPHRINRAIELLEQGQPIYYTGSHEGTDGSFEQGVKDDRPGPTTSATTWNTRQMPW